MNFHMYYDRETRSWWGYWYDEKGDQIGDAVFGHKREHCYNTLLACKPEGRYLHTIAAEILRVWGKNVSAACKPYLSAMLRMDSIEDRYLLDSGRSIVSYFLANAGCFRGEDARRLKAELKVMLDALDSERGHEHA